MYAAERGDEIDVEILGGDVTHWQTNSYAPAPSDKGPLWGVFGGIHKYPTRGSTVAALHSYTVDWNEERIIWSVDGTAVRTLSKSEWQ